MASAAALPLGCIGSASAITFAKSIAYKPVASARRLPVLGLPFWYASQAGGTRPLQRESCTISTSWASVIWMLESEIWKLEICTSCAEICELRLSALQP